MSRSTGDDSPKNVRGLHMFLKILFYAFGLISIGNGIWMLVSPETWYHDVPAAVPDTGAYNPHFIRDIGLAYFISGVGFIWMGSNVSRAYVVLVGQALFAAGHAVLHVIDVIMGRLPLDHIWIDAPGILIPGLFIGILCIPAVWKRFAGEPSEQET